MSVIELKNISQVYDGTNVVLKDLNLTIEDRPNKGQFIALLGPSGCGKSTLLRYISGLQKPTAGEVKLFGKPRTEDDRVGMVFQKYSSLPWLSVLDNISLGLKLQGMGKAARTTKAKEILEIVGLKGHGNKYAQYPTLSGGQLQRVAIARSLLANPRILMMDEPFGALDVKTRLKMQDSLQEIYINLNNQGNNPTVLLVTHDIQEAVYLADDIFILGKAPAKVEHHIKVALPEKRDRNIKRENFFREIVAQVEDIMMGIGD
jgi:NitT/TauT family transport system ATP-binding protein